MDLKLRKELREFIEWRKKRDSLREYYKNLADTKERKLNIKIK